MKLAVAVFAFLLLLNTDAAQSAESIVGAWHFPDENCDSAIRLGAMSMKSEDVNCKFTSVKRVGNRVTWKGVCDDAEGSTQETVVATLKGKRLTIAYVKGGNVLRDLQKCGR
jgi:hypothetical protein